MRLFLANNIKKILSKVLHIQLIFRKEIPSKKHCLWHISNIVQFKFLLDASSMKETALLECFFFITCDRLHVLQKRKSI
jgi:hypothetical protein